MTVFGAATSPVLVTVRVSLWPGFSVDAAMPTEPNVMMPLQNDSAMTTLPLAIALTNYMTVVSRTRSRAAEQVDVHRPDRVGQDAAGRVASRGPLVDGRREHALDFDGEVDVRIDARTGHLEGGDVGGGGDARRGHVAGRLDRADACQLAQQVEVSLARIDENRSTPPLPHLSRSPESSRRSQPEPEPEPEPT